jgi:hypothetical protein
MTGHEREIRPLELAVHEVQVGAADPAGRDLEQQLPRPRLRFRDIRRPQGGARCVEDHRTHVEKGYVAFVV